MHADWMTDATLDSTIQFQHRFLESSKDPKAIFLTGATGFIGGYLLSQLLRETRATIYCLVRGESPLMAQQRLEKQLHSYQLWQEQFKDRLIPVIGDLSQPRLGLSEPQFNHLAHQIEVIYHSGAHLNLASPYDHLKATNVAGTQELLRLASLGGARSFHFISSVVVFFSQPYQNQCVLETDVPHADVTLKGGYQQSKWAAEQLVWQARERGLPVCIYRCGRVTGDSRTGIFTYERDLLWKVVKGCIELKKYPVVPTTLSLIPVNYISQAIAHLSQQQASWGKAFHLTNPISWLELWQQIIALGYPLQPTDYETWVSEINRQPAQNQLFAQLRILLRSPLALFRPKPQFDNRQTEQGLRETAIHCPPIDQTLLNTYFTYFQRMGYLPSPSA